MHDDREAFDRRAIGDRRSRAIAVWVAVILFAAAVSLFFWILNNSL